MAYFNFYKQNEYNTYQQFNSHEENKKSFYNGLFFVLIFGKDFANQGHTQSPLPREC